MEGGITALAVSEEIGDAGAVGAAHGELVAGDEDDGVFAVGFGADFFDEMQVDYGGSVDAEEDLGVEFFLKARHGFAEEVGLAVGADADVVLFGADPADVG